MPDAQQIYDTGRAFGSALRMGVNFSTCILQALVLKGVLTRDEATMLIDQAQRSAVQADVPEYQQTIANATFDQVRELFRQM